MSRELPPFERPPRSEGPETAARKHRHYNPLLIFGIALFGVGAFYLLLVVVTQADQIFFPGNELKIGVKIPGLDTGSDPESADINERINILFLGLDQRRDDSPDTPSRTDSVFVLTVDPFSKTAGIFSIPRDLALEIPDGAGGYITDRINVAYEMGEYTYDGYPGGGAGLAEDTVEHNFDIPIDYHVILNFNNFIDIIDELGGIDVDVPEYAYDYAYNDCNACPYYPVEFLPGPQHMAGERALAYARIRKSDNDFKRIERQQLVIKATARRGMDLGIVLPDKALDLFKAYKGAIKTDVPDYKIGGLALLAQQVGVDTIRTVSLAPAVFPCNCSAGALLSADWDMVEELKASVFADGRLQREAALVKVENGTLTAGLGDEFAAFFRKQGLAGEQIEVNEAGMPVAASSTIIVDLSAKTYTAEKLAEWLKIPASRIKTAADPEAAAFLGAEQDVVVVLGADARLPSVAAAPGG